MNDRGAKNSLVLLGATAVVFLWVLAACAKPSLGYTDQPSGVPFGVGVVTSDFSTGELLIFRPGRELARAPIHSDASVLVPPAGPFLVAINKHLRDSLQWIDRDTGETRGEFSLGIGSNPMDGVFLNNGEILVSRYHSDALWLGNFQVTGNAPALSTFRELSMPWASVPEDTDGRPEMAFMIRAGKFALVALQYLDSQQGFRPTGRSAVATIALMPSPVYVGFTWLHCENPVTGFIQTLENENEAGFLVGGAGMMGYLSKLDGCVEELRLNKTTGKVTSSGPMVTEATLGGDIVDIEVLDDTRAVALVSSARDLSRAVVFELSSGRIMREIHRSRHRLSDVVVHAERIFLLESSLKSPAIHSYDIQSLEKTDFPFNLPADMLPPQQLVWWPEHK
jgi:hypothetical protein